MLTSEEERQRAIKVSKLYLRTSKKSIDKKLQINHSFRWSKIIMPSIVLSVPFIAANVVYAIFTDLDYLTRSDVAAGGIVFILSFLSVVYCIYLGLKYFLDKLERTVINARLIFWLTILFSVPPIMFLRHLIIGNSTQGIYSLLSEAAFYIPMSIFVSIFAVIVLTCMLERLKANDTIKVRLALSFTSLPYVAGLIFALVK